MNMFHVQGPPKNSCNLLAVLSGKSLDSKPKQPVVSDTGYRLAYPFPELTSSGRLEVQVLTNPAIDEVGQVLETSQPNFVYLQGELLDDGEEIGSFVLGDTNLSSENTICGLFGSSAALPTTVYLEIPYGEKMAEALHSKGIPYVIYWKNAFSRYAACHFRQALFSVVQSSCSHTWDTFQLAHASFRLYCVRNNYVLPSNSQNEIGQLGPHLLGDPPKIDVVLPEADPEEEKGTSEIFHSIKIYDEDVNMRLLVCGGPCTLDECLLGSLEDGLNALLSIEIRGSKLHNRSSAPPPPLQAGTFSRGVVTMRCDFSTTTSAHISLLVSGSAQTCFNDELMESHIKNEVIENSQLVQALPSCEESKLPSSEPRKSAAVACGASVFEVFFKVPAWALQVLRQLAPDVSYRSLATLGIASIQGLSVASFEKDDAERLLFFCKRQDEENQQRNVILSEPPSWFKPPLPSRKWHESCQDTKPLNANVLESNNGSVFKPIFKVATMRPIPHTRRHKLLPFSRISGGDRHDVVDQTMRNSPAIPPKRASVGPSPHMHRKSLSTSYQAHQIISLNPLPLKKHGCGRPPFPVCLEEEFLRDVMEFLILRGHSRLIPQGGLAEFPDAILNAKRLDLYNLYREVVSRGGFHVGNGINWKGQVFSKMRNHTLTNRMTGVGNTLKRHYETYLLEYELAHDDVDGECCLLCHSSAAGDWVNCGICGEWAHFGCDRRQGLGAFKDYAKTDGLEYICPHCSVTNFKRKSQKMSNGY